MKKMQNILFIALIVIIGYQQYQLYILKNEMVGQLKQDVSFMRKQLYTLFMQSQELKDKMLEAKKTDSVIDRRIKHFNYKLKKYEKISTTSINNLKRDSIRAILKAN